MGMSKDKNGVESDRFGTCDICGDAFDIEHGEVAEMYDPKDSLDVDKHVIVHGVCGRGYGLELA